VPPKPNDCENSVCEDLGNGEGRCAEGPFDVYCDAIVAADGGGLVRCLSNADCETLALGVEAGACTLEEQRACFNDVIVAQGAPSPVAPLGAAAYCTPATNSQGINAVAGLPGPGRLRYQSVLQLFCSDDVTAPYQPGVGGCPPPQQE
jgi:hypothetical protein